MKIRELTSGSSDYRCDGCASLRAVTHIERRDGPLNPAKPLRTFCVDCARRLNTGEEMTTFYRTHLPTGTVHPDARFFANDSKALEALGRWNDMGGKVWKYTLNRP